jgi:hypothetical protein
MKQDFVESPMKRYSVLHVEDDIHQLLQKARVPVFDYVDIPAQESARSVRERWPLLRDVMGGPAPDSNNPEAS